MYGLSKLFICAIILGCKICDALGSSTQATTETSPEQILDDDGIKTVYMPYQSNRSTIWQSNKDKARYLLQPTTKWWFKPYTISSIIGTNYS